MKILIIDDSHACQIKTQMVLEDIGYRVHYIANNTDEALKIINSKPIDLIISDIILENELIFELKSLLLVKKIPCIFVTAAPIEKNYEQTKAFPNSRFLMKPFQALSLRAAIDSLNIETEKEVKGVYVTGKFRQKILLPFDEILWLDAEGNYTTINTVAQKRYTIKRSLSQLSGELDKRFLQVQRAAFVNMEYVKRVDFSQEEINVNGNMIKIGRTYHSTIAQYMNMN